MTKKKLTKRQKQILQSAVAEYVAWKHYLTYGVSYFSVPYRFHVTERKI